jgi:hypothetical protein
VTTPVQIDRSEVKLGVMPTLWWNDDFWTAVQPVTPNLRLAQLPEGSELRKRAEEFNRRYAEFLALLGATSGFPQSMKSA